jgi:hypothetical protein
MLDLESILSTWSQIFHLVSMKCFFFCFLFVPWQSHYSRAEFEPFKYLLTVILLHLILTGKAVPLQAWSGPKGSRKLRFPDFLTTAQYGGKVVSLTNRPHLPPGNTPGTHFCYRLSRPQGHSAIGRIMSTEKSNDTSGIEQATFRFVAQYLNHSNNSITEKYNFAVRLEIVALL